MTTHKPAHLLFFFVFLPLFSLQRSADAQWKVAPGDYVSYGIEGRIGVKHVGFFGSHLDGDRKLATEPTHPALLSLALVTRLPEGELKKGSRVRVLHTFGHFEAYTPVRVDGNVVVREVVGPLVFLKGTFKLKRVRPQGKDQRFYQITDGVLNFSGQFNSADGVLTEAAVEYNYRYDEHVALAGIYTKRNVKQQKRVAVTASHVYRLDAVVQQSEQRQLVDEWVDEAAKEILDSWRGEPNSENVALKLGYDCLYTLALLHAQIPKKNEAIQKAWMRIQGSPISSTYSAAMLLLLIEAMNTPDNELADPERFRERPPERALSKADRSVAQRAVRYLLKGQQAGGWHYVGVNSDRKFFPGVQQELDNSNTQFALLGLHAAMRMRAKIPAKVWRNALGYWRRMFCKVGYKPKGERNILAGWDYNEGGRGQSYLSMTAGGVASLYIIAAGLGVKPGDKSRDGKAIGVLLKRGSAWLARFFTVRHARRCRFPREDDAADWAYHLYAIERAGDLGNFKKIGLHDWYRDGAMAILGGSYGNMDRNHVFNALCLLFLRRSSPAAVTIAPK